MMAGPQGEAFRTTAAYYEVLSDSKARLQREGPLLAEWLQRAPGRRVWDIACGTGLHAAFMAQLGADVLARDASPEMVCHAQARRPHDRVTYETGDMRSLPDATADLILCLGNSLSLLQDVAEVESVVAQAAARLAPGGLFCVQVVNNRAEGMDKPRHRVERKETEQGTVVAVKSLVPQGDKTLLGLNFFYEPSDSDASDTPESVCETATLLHLSLEEFEGAAAKADLRVSTVFGGFDRAGFDYETSSDLIVVMEKA